MQICEGPVFRSHPVGTIPPIRKDPNPERSSFSNALRGGNTSPNRKVPNPMGSPIREDPNPKRSSFSNALRGGNALPNRKVPNPLGSFFTMLPFTSIRKGPNPEGVLIDNLKGSYFSNAPGSVLNSPIRKVLFC